MSKPPLQIVVSKPHPTKEWLQAFWQEVKAIRESGPAAELEATLMEAARKSGLIKAVNEMSRHGEEDVRHVIRWGLAGRNPWH